MPMRRSFSHAFTEFIAAQTSASPCMKHIGGVASSKENSGTSSESSSLPPLAFGLSTPSVSA